MGRVDLMVELAQVELFHQTIRPLDPQKKLGRVKVQLNQYSVTWVRGGPYQALNHRNRVLSINIAITKKGLVDLVRSVSGAG